MSSKLKYFRIIRNVVLLLGVQSVLCEEEKRKFQFGRAMRQEFFMSPNYVNLNHAAYGTHPKAVSRALHKYQERSERNPELWIRRDSKTELDIVRRLLAEFVNAKDDDVVLIPNATSGLNGIFRSMVFMFGDRILHLNTVYKAVGNLIQFLVDYSQGAITKIVFNITYPMTNDEFVDKFDNFLKANRDPSRPIRIAVVDHITSVPGVVNPIHRIIPLLKSYNITVVIDGAHAIGQVPINLTYLDPDYYVTNCHKWLYSSRGSALMYVKKKHQPFIHPAHISSSYRQPADFQREFYWTGTMDYSPYMTIPAALEFRQEVGGESAIMGHNHELAYKGGNLMAERMGTEIVQYKEQIGSMVDVRLPVLYPDHPMLDPEWWIDEQLFKHPVTFSLVYKHNGKWYARVSAQIYNDISDFEVCAKHFMDICKDLNKQLNATGPLHRRRKRSAINVQMFGDGYEDH